MNRHYRFPGSIVRMVRIYTVAAAPTISNYKISFHTHHPLRDTLDELYKIGVKLKHGIGFQIRLHHNFAIIRIGRYVYSPNYSGFINITGIKNLDEIDIAIRTIYTLLDITYPTSKDVLQYRVDNISASGSFGWAIALHRIQSFLELHPEYPASCRYRRHYFPGATVRYHNGGGSAIFFTSGKFTIVGAKTEQQVQRIYGRAMEIALYLRG